MLCDECKKAISLPEDIAKSDNWELIYCKCDSCGKVLLKDDLKKQRIAKRLEQNKLAMPQYKNNDDVIDVLTGKRITPEDYGDLNETDKTT